MLFRLRFVHCAITKAPIANFIHFNLSMSLMIGLIVFISGVETAKDTKVISLFHFVNPDLLYSSLPGCVDAV